MNPYGVVKGKNPFMRPIGIAILSSLILASGAHAETTRMAIEFAGAPAGENVYETFPDGTFTSKTILSVGSVELKSNLTGKFEGGLLIEFRCEDAPPGQGQRVITYSKHKLNVKMGKNDTDLPTKIGNEPYFGNLHPQLTASVLGKVDFSKTSAQKIRAFAPDLGSFISPSFTPIEKKTTPKGTAEMFKMTLATVEATYGVDESNHVVLMDVPAQKLRFIVSGWEALVKDPLAAYPELSQSTYKFKVDKGIKMTTRDGVVLVQDVVRPDAPGKFPVILVRTPYGRSSSTVEGGFYASRGYVYVVQDCRGRGDSAGLWDPFMFDRKDGYDAVQWSARQEWSDGNVGMIGGSYGGFVQWAAAVENPPALKCIVPQVSPSDAMLNLPYDNGAFFLYGAVWWAKIVSSRTIDLSSFMSKLPSPEKLSTLPLSKVDSAVLGKKVPFFANWLKRSKASDWKGFNYEDDLKKVTIPALHISGWWDGDEIGTMVNWQIMRSLGRKNQWLVYGPWTHLFNSTSKIGDTDFGPTALIDLDSVYLRWFDTWLKHKDVNLDKQPHVRAFITGVNKWVESTDWPIAGSTPMKLYLSASGPVEGSSSTGQLLLKTPALQAPSKYRYDPHDGKISEEFLNPDPDKATLNPKIGKKESGLVLFKSEPLKENLAIGGPIVLDLRFSTTAHDTDFYVNLLDIDEKGKFSAMGQAGKIRCSYRESLNKQVPLKPGQIYGVKIRLWDTAHQFAKGHQICLVMTSTEFPMFARNLGTIEPIATATRMEVQDQKIFHDQKNPSSLSFQVIK